jgi:hypothetical protein
MPVGRECCAVVVVVNVVQNNKPCQIRKLKHKQALLLSDSSEIDDV